MISSQDQLEAKVAELTAQVADLIAQRDDALVEHHVYILDLADILGLSIDSYKLPDVATAIRKLIAVAKAAKAFCDGSRTKPPDELEQDVEDALAALDTP